MTAISADESFGRPAEVPAQSIAAPRRRSLRHVRTELTMIGSGCALVLFSVAYGITHLF